jgi:hypothetical protein
LRKATSEEGIPVGGLRTIKLREHDVPFSDIEVMKAHETKLCKEKRNAFGFMLFCMVTGKFLFSKLVLYVESSLRLDGNSKPVLTH